MNDGHMTTQRTHVGWTFWYAEDQSTSRHYEIHEKPAGDLVADVERSGGLLLPLYIDAPTEPPDGEP